MNRTTTCSRPAVARGCAARALLCGILLLAGLVRGATTYSLYQSTNEGTTWTRVGRGLPGDSRINALTAVEQRVIAGTDRGAFVSNDAGATWRPALPGPAREARVLCLATVEERVFAGTHQHGVLVSEDAGDSWTAMNSGLEDRYVRALVAVGKRLFAGSDRLGVFVTEDGGKSWRRISAGLPAAAQVFDLAELDGAVFAGLYAKGIYRLVGGESVWHSAGGVQPLELATTARALIVGHNPGGVFVSRDHGRNWQDGNQGLPVNVPVWTLTADATRVFAGATGKIGPAEDVVGLFKSWDHGQTWIRADHGLPRAAAAISFLLRDEFVLAGIVALSDP